MSGRLAPVLLVLIEVIFRGGGYVSCSEGDERQAARSFLIGQQRAPAVFGKRSSRMLGASKNAPRVPPIDEVATFFSFPPSRTMRPLSLPCHARAAVRRQTSLSARAGREQCRRPVVLGGDTHESLSVLGGIGGRSTAGRAQQRVPRDNDEGGGSGGRQGGGRRGGSALRGRGSEMETAAEVKAYRRSAFYYMSACSLVVVDTVSLALALLYLFERCPRDASVRHSGIGVC